MRHTALAVGILTYNRPTLLRRTISSLQQRSRLTRDIAIFDNGSCGPDLQANRSLAQSFGVRLHTRSSSIPIAESIADRERHIADGHAELAGLLLLSQTASAFIILEDDWLWHRDIQISDIVRVLQARPDVGQVRLRSARYDGSLRGYARNNFVTGADLRWQSRMTLASAQVRLGNLHWTNNPSVVLRHALLIASAPFRSELDRMETFASHYPLNGQLVPGCVRHIGPWRERTDLLARGVHHGPWLPKCSNMP